VTRVFRHSACDGLLVAGVAGHAAALAVLSASPGVPAAAVAAAVAVLLWWDAQTASHNFLHNPFFRARSANVFFSVLLSLACGFPQSYWRQRHLVHHGLRAKARVDGACLGEGLLVLSLWGTLAAQAPRFFLLAYLPGWTAGLALCWLQGRGEHAGGREEGVSFYGRLYNLAMFRDGWHAEHHARPGTHWTRLERSDEQASAFPPLLRWLDALVPAAISALERAVLRFPGLQRAVLRSHERAMRDVLPEGFAPATACVVGGGIFPRTALILRRLFPDCDVTVVDRSARSIRLARPFADARFLRQTYDPSRRDWDLVVIPLSYVGDREALRRDPPAPAVVVHDWLWRPGRETAVVSPWLLKRVNLFRAARVPATLP
jgi:hypothetical protein